MFSCGMACVSETSLPSRWHLPQSSGMFITATGDLASLWERMPWPPWQVMQVGAIASPRAAALPWRLACCSVATPAWQPLQAASACFALAIPCGWLWQSMQVALGFSPAAPAWAPTVAAFASSLWHWAQVAVTCAGPVAEPGVFAAAILCATPWHSRHEGVAFPGAPCTLAASFSPAS